MAHAKILLQRNDILHCKCTAACHLSDRCAQRLVGCEEIGGKLIRALLGLTFRIKFFRTDIKPGIIVKIQMI